ncbi:MAG TPA: zf-HC2 domain-containing protein, partial [Kofleriaceae bacterium]|nr:zf-HC2 domain-containing protein [Kofleriaceae bacterium]
MDCSSLPDFLDGDLPPGARAHFEQHLAGCTACQDAAEAAMQMWALGGELAQRSERPHAVVPQPRRATRYWRAGAAAVALAAVVALLLFRRGEPPLDPDHRVAAELAPHRAMMERLPYAPLDRHRDHEVMRAGPAQSTTAPAELGLRPAAAAPGEPISMATLAELEHRGSGVELIAALIARGDLTAAASRLQQAGPGDDLDVERALVAELDGQSAAALALLDQVLARTRRHAQALWNRAVALADLDLPLAAAEAFDACAAL